MKITLWGINYSPESIGIAPFNRELCDYLAGRGHEVSAVTAFPYYPHWKKSVPDRRRLFGSEQIGGVAVYRCFCYVPAMASCVRRIAHELSFALSSTLRLLFLPRADIYVVVTPPLALGFFAWLVTTVKRSRFVFHVQDLQPDAAVGLGMLPKGGLVRALYAAESFAYAKAAAVSGISGGMITAFRQKGVPPVKCMFLPNWRRHDSALVRDETRRAATRQALGIAEDSLLALYSGNLGRKQNLEIIIDAAALLLARPPSGGARVSFVIVGDGAARPELERRLRASPGVDVRLLPLQSDADYAALLGAADVALITQAEGTGQFFVPSKLLSVLAAGLPVVAVVDEGGELARAVRTGGFGKAVKSGDVVGLARVLGQVAASRSQLAAWAARTVWVRQFSRETILPRFEKVLVDAAVLPWGATATAPDAAQERKAIGVG